MPQKMTLQQFGQTIKAKYPDYASRGDEEIGQAMLAKYPEYRERVETGKIATPPPAGGPAPTIRSQPQFSDTTLGALTTGVDPSTFVERLGGAAGSVLNTMLPSGSTPRPNAMPETTPQEEIGAKVVAISPIAEGVASLAGVAEKKLGIAQRLMKGAGSARAAVKEIPSVGIPGSMTGLGVQTAKAAARPAINFGAGQAEGIARQLALTDRPPTSSMAAPILPRQSEIPFNQPPVAGTPLEATFKSPASPSPEIEMANPPTETPQLSKAKELRNFAYGGDPAVANIEQGIAPSGREAQASTLRIAPKLAEDPILAKAKGLRFDQELFNKFKTGEAEVSAAEQSIPRTSSIPQQPITDGLEAIIQKYIELGEPEAAGAIRNEWRKWSEKESIIPWDDFLARKRQLGKNIQTTGGWRETGTAADKAKAAALREAYGVLMDSTSQLSERLQKANSAYSTIRDALDDAGMDLRTGRRFARVGKEPPPAPFGQQ